MTQETESQPILPGQSNVETSAWEKLREVEDPEIGCNIVDLGMVRQLEFLGTTLRVALSPTTRGCPMQESLAYGVRVVLLSMRGVDEVDVEMVWDPPWEPSMMTDAGRRFTGVEIG